MEPLQSLLQISDDKHTDLITYLPTETASQLQRHEYIDPNKDELYLNENIVCVSKATGLVTNYGKILKINDTIVTLKQSYRNLYIDTKEIYIFRKLRKSRDTKNDRGFYEALLNIF